jgi:hypothetical protein
MGNEDILRVDDLHERHPGLSERLAGAYCEAARVCLDRHHEPPTRFDVKVDGESGKHLVEWTPADARARKAHGNEIEATEMGAYAVALVCLAYRMHLVAIGRPPHGDGFDWYVAPLGHEFDDAGVPNYDAPEVMALEVSGVDRGPVGARVEAKKDQIRRGRRAERGVAAVVGFERSVVQMETI